MIEVNADLDGRPAAVNEDCYGDGWMVVLAPSETGEIGSLLDAERYRKYVEERDD